MSLCTRVHDFRELSFQLGCPHKPAGSSNCGVCNLVLHRGENLLNLFKVRGSWCGCAVVHTQELKKKNLSSFISGEFVLHMFRNHQFLSEVLDVLCSEFKKVSLSLIRNAVEREVSFCRTTSTFWCIEFHLADWFVPVPFATLEGCARRLCSTVNDVEQLEEMFPLIRSECSSGCNVGKLASGMSLGCWDQR